MEKASVELNPKQRRRALIILGPALLVLVGTYFFVFGGRYVSTDDAYVKGHKVAISTEISGRIDEVKIADNMQVSAGQQLFTIQKQPFEIAAAQAQANLGAVKTDIESSRADYLQKQAKLAQAEEDIHYQEREFTRYSQLIRNNTVAQEKLDQVRHDLMSAQKNRDAATQDLASTEAKLGGDYNTPVEQHPRYLQALAALDKARLDLARTSIFAPSNGVTANVNLRPGEFVAIGLPIFSIIDDTSLWVEANFKETDLTYVRPGERVEMSVDTYPGKTWEGTVSSITPGTGSEFSILPAQNSTGNWVKVTQRVMVRVEFKDYNGTPPLRSGLSTSVSIDTGHTRFGRWIEFWH